MPVNNKPLRYRQIHLDFHTSEHIPDVGAEFDPDNFVATLKRRMSTRSPCSPSATTAGPITRRKWERRIRTSPDRTSWATWCAR